MRAPLSPGVYVHLPFCPYLCPYCDFAKWRHDASAAERYLGALRAEVLAAPALLARTLYVGGGTPNTYPPGHVAALVREIHRRFGLPEGAEASIETNPDLALCQGFDAYLGAGLNRISIGAQSFVPSELKTLGRRHGPAEVGEAVRRARAAGFGNVSLDLMFGVPGQTLASWCRSLESSLELEVEHLSTYALTIEHGTPFERWYARAPAAFGGQDLQAEMYEAAIDTLTAAGFEHYEISNFARPGFRCRHNLNYWANGEYLGLGVGAASYLGGERRSTTKDRRAYEAAALAGRPIPAEREHLAPRARVGEAAMLALRTAEGVELRSFAERYDVLFDVMFRSILEELSAAGLLRISATHVALTRRGRLLGNEVCGAFLESA